MFNMLGAVIDSILDFVAHFVLPLDEPIDWIGTDEELL